LTVGGTARVLVTVTDGTAGVADVAVSCELAEGSANQGADITGAGPTDTDGQVTCSWTGENEGDDTLTVSADLNGDGDTEDEGESVTVTVKFAQVLG
ncbi:MAG UNVERIFIED_CONTAM: hypothetical protein LOD86_07705, partial [Thermobifida fusca]